MPVLAFPFLCLQRPGKEEMEESTEKKTAAAEDGSERAENSQGGRKRGKKAAPRRGGHSRSRAAGRNTAGCLVRILLAAVLIVLSFGIGYHTGRNAKDSSSRQYIDLSAVVAPDWINQDFIDVNKYSRPGIKLEQVNNIVIHYVANPGTTAEQNRSYFAGLANQSGSRKTHASCHFIIGLDGEIIQIIPIDEISYASNNRNSDTIAIECCHPEEDGKFTDETYNSLVKLCAWLCGELDLTQKDLIRHYDINGKLCPKYFVEHEDAWEDFKKDVKKAL